ncbi:MAG: hypothetical protein EZS28_015410 [Streblomastix strix]|uniref:Uncharacterized protein n=1 Tax=Streblomastix strix TaxID=222440 RepID=A0A5J4W254_9EUKA|nr:MAG: hypothetical protein EZS28_015410 [Streblomastix strix]
MDYAIEEEYGFNSNFGKLIQFNEGNQGLKVNQFIKLRKFTAIQLLIREMYRFTKGPAKITTLLVNVAMNVIGMRKRNYDLLKEKDIGIQKEKEKQQDIDKDNKQDENKKDINKIKEIQKQKTSESEILNQLADKFALEGGTHSLLNILLFYLHDTTSDPIDEEQYLDSQIDNEIQQVTKRAQFEAEFQQSNKEQDKNKQSKSSGSLRSGSNPNSSRNKFNKYQSVIRKAFDDAIDIINSAREQERLQYDKIGISIDIVKKASSIVTTLFLSSSLAKRQATTGKSQVTNQTNNEIDIDDEDEEYDEEEQDNIDNIQQQHQNSCPRAAEVLLRCLQKFGSAEIGKVERDASFRIAQSLLAIIDESATIGKVNKNNNVNINNKGNQNKDQYDFDDESDDYEDDEEEEIENCSQMTSKQKLLQQQQKQQRKDKINKSQQQQATNEVLIETQKFLARFLWIAAEQPSGASKIMQLDGINVLTECLQSCCKREKNRENEANSDSQKLSEVELISNPDYIVSYDNEQNQQLSGSGRLNVHLNVNLSRSGRIDQNDTFRSGRSRQSLISLSGREKDGIAGSNKCAESVLNAGTIPICLILLQRKDISDDSRVIRGIFGILSCLAYREGTEQQILANGAKLLVDAALAHYKQDEAVAMHFICLLWNLGSSEQSREMLGKQNAIQISISILEYEITSICKIIEESNIQGGRERNKTDNVGNNINGMSEIETSSSSSNQDKIPNLQSIPEKQSDFQIHKLKQNNLTNEQKEEIILGKQITDILMRCMTILAAVLQDQKKARIDMLKFGSNTLMNSVKRAITRKQTYLTEVKNSPRLLDQLITKPKIDAQLKSFSVITQIIERISELTGQKKEETPIINTGIDPSKKQQSSRSITPRQGQQSSRSAGSVGSRRDSKTNQNQQQQQKDQIKTTKPNTKQGK